MSEFEKAQREAYQKRRQKIKYALLAVVLLFSVVTAAMSAVFLNLDAATYVAFREEGTALYHAYLNDNEYYEEEFLNGNHAYVSSLIHHMDAAFTYRSEMEADDVTFRYRYWVDARLVVADIQSGAAIYNPVETLLDPTEESHSGRVLSITPKVDIDYVRYNDRAKNFIAAYNLKDVSAYLDVTMYVDVVGMSESFAADSAGQYTVQVRIPLNRNTLKPHTTSTIPTGPQKILANPNEHKSVFRTVAVIFGILDGVAMVAAAFYIVKTRDVHIDYARKVQKLVGNYKSFIQRINTPFDETGYQTLAVDTFGEMLEIRDTLQLPILLHENEDKTRAVFMIPVGAQLLYTYEIKVDNYDEIYAVTEEAACEPCEDDAVAATELEIDAEEKAEIDLEAAENEAAEAAKAEEPSH